LRVVIGFDVQAGRFEAEVKFLISFIMPIYRATNLTRLLANETVISPFVGPHLTRIFRASKRLTIAKYWEEEASEDGDRKMVVGERELGERWHGGEAMDIAGVGEVLS